jgi:alanyl-tRNA synthetase
LQELGQSGISLIKKSQLKTQFEKMSKELLAQQKAKLAADQKMVCFATARGRARPQ